MVKAVSRDQALEVSGRFATQIDWTQIDGQKLQEEVIGLSPEEFGRRFTSFIKAGARFSFGGLKVATAPFDLAKFINKDWTYWKGPKDGKGLEGEEERDKASLLITEVDFEKADLLTCLEKGESSITGEEKLIRLRKLNRTLYGANVFMGLWQDYQQNKAQSVLEKLYQQRGITYIDFFGDILRVRAATAACCTSIGAAMARGTGTTTGSAAIGTIGTSPRFPSKYLLSSPWDFEPLPCPWILCPLHFLTDLRRAIFFAKIYLVIGESCGRSRFPAAESSIRMLRAFAIKVSDGGHTNYFQKRRYLV